MGSENLSAEQRLARLEARSDARGTITVLLVFAALAAWMLWSAGVLKLDFAKADGG